MPKTKPKRRRRKEFLVIVHETTELAYRIKAFSPAEAYSIWANTDDSDKNGRGEPSQEESLGTEFVHLIDGDVTHDDEGLLVEQHIDELKKAVWPQRRKK